MWVSGVYSLLHLPHMYRNKNSSVYQTVCCLTFSTPSYLVLYKRALLHKFHCNYVQAVGTSSHQQQFCVICSSELLLSILYSSVFSCHIPHVEFSGFCGSCFSNHSFIFRSIPHGEGLFRQFGETYCLHLQGDGEIMGRRIRTDLAGRSEGIVSTQCCAGGVGVGRWVRLCGKSV
jgi:hypothetical protein